MKAIVAVDKFWGIGKNNGLLFHIPEDMAFFKSTTLNKVVVMGINTLKSFPQGKPLKNRVNIVLHSTGEKIDDCFVVKNLEELKGVLREYNSDDVFVIGGAKVYGELIEYCSEIYVTKVDADGNAEVFFRDLDKDENWECTSKSGVINSNGYNIRFTVYKNLNLKPF